MKAACCLTYALYRARIRASAVGASSSPWWNGRQHACTHNTVSPRWWARACARKRLSALPHMLFQTRMGRHPP